MSGRRRRTSRRNMSSSSSTARRAGQATGTPQHQGSSQAAMETLHALLQTSSTTTSSTALGEAADTHRYHSSSQMQNLYTLLQANQPVASIGLSQVAMESNVRISESSMMESQLTFEQRPPGVFVPPLPPGLLSPGLSQGSLLGQSSFDLMPVDLHPRRQTTEGATSAADAADAFASRMHGPCYCKLLVPDHVAGALIGKEGSMIGEIEMISQCTLQISAKKSYFPGTRDRIVLLSGTLEQVQEGLGLVQQRLCDSTRHKFSTIMCKLAAPRSAISALIGRGGNLIKLLSNKHDCSINISERVQECSERLVLISGETDSVKEATVEIVTLLQVDPNLHDHLNLTYTYELPLGTWDKDIQPQTDIPLISPRSARKMNKQDLIEYLRKISPRELLLRRNLLGDIKNTKKSQGLEDLIEAVAEVWTLYHGGLTEADTYMAQILLPSESTSDSTSDMATTTPSTAMKYGSPSWIMAVAQQPRSLTMRRLPVDMVRDRRPQFAPLPLPLPVGQVEPGTALRAIRGEVKPSELVQSEDFENTQEKHERRALTALELLQDDSDLEPIFCGPSSEADESGNWLEEQVDSYRPIEISERLQDQGLNTDQELLGNSAETQSDRIQTQHVESLSACDIQEESVNTGASSSTGYSSVGLHVPGANAGRRSIARTSHRITAKSKSTAVRRNVSQTRGIDMPQYLPPRGAQGGHSTFQNLAGFGLQQSDDFEANLHDQHQQLETLRLACIGFLNHLFQKDASCYPVWFSYATKHSNGSPNPSDHGIASLRQFLRNYFRDNQHLENLLRQWASSQQRPTSMPAGSGYESSPMLRRLNPQHAFQPEVAAGSVHMMVPLGSRITISLESNAAVQPSVQPVTPPSIPQLRQLLARGPHFSMESAVAIASSSGGTGSTEDTTLSEPSFRGLDTASRSINDVSEVSATLPWVTEYLSRQSPPSSALAQQLAEHGIPTETPARITVGQRVLNHYAEEGQTPFQPFSQSPHTSSLASRSVGLLPSSPNRRTANPQETFELPLEPARRGSF